MDWVRQGYKTAVLFGRFQPLLAGQQALIRHIRGFGLDTHVISNEKPDSPAEPNPYNFDQKVAMFRRAMPELPCDHLHSVRVRLDGDGDVGADVGAFREALAAIDAPERIVIFYVVKTEDVKDYLVNGANIANVHYVDLFVPPHGACAKHIVEKRDIPVYPDLSGDALVSFGRFQVVPVVAEYLEQLEQQAQKLGCPIGDLAAEGAQRPVQGAVSIFGQGALKA